MAYNKKYAELGDNVLDYVNNREDAIEQGFSDVDTDINGVSQELNNFKAEVADYVIESGSNSNGNWEKWNSGKLVQWGLMVWQKDNKVLTFPLPFVNNNYTPFTQMDAVQEFDRSVSVNRTSSSTMTVYIFNGPTQMGVHYQAIGRWK